MPLSSTITLHNHQQIPAMGLGTWKIKPQKAYDVVRLAIQIGYRHIDCAPIYGNQQEIGQAIQDAIKDKEIQREDLWITSKLWNAFHEPKAVRLAFQNTLSELQLDYLDLYLIHWPVATHQYIGYQAAQQPGDFISPASCPLSHTWEAMTALPKNQVKSLGVSNCAPHHIDSLLQAGLNIPVINQVETHPYLPQNELLSYCKKHRIHVTAYSPLGSSDRPKILKSKDEPPLLGHPAIQRIAQQCHMSVAQVLLVWGLQRGTAVIPKASTTQHLKQNLQTVMMTLPTSAINTIDNIAVTYRFIKGDHFTITGSPYSQDYLWKSPSEH